MGNYRRSDLARLTRNTGKVERIGKVAAIFPGDAGIAGKRGTAAPRSQPELRSVDVSRPSGGFRARAKRCGRGLGVR